MSKQQKIRFPKRELWIGLAKVEQSSRNGVLGDADRAYTNAIAIADSRDSFRAAIKQTLAELRLRLLRLENAETLKSRLSKHSINEELAKLAEEARVTGQVSFGTFHAFDIE